MDFNNVMKIVEQACQGFLVSYKSLVFSFNSHVYLGDAFPAGSGSKSAVEMSL